MPCFWGDAYTGTRSSWSMQHLAFIKSTLRTQDRQDAFHSTTIRSKEEERLSCTGNSAQARRIREMRARWGGDSNTTFTRRTDTKQKCTRSVFTGLDACILQGIWFLTFPSRVIGKPLHRDHLCNGTKRQDSSAVEGALCSRDANGHFHEGRRHPREGRATLLNVTQKISWLCYTPWTP